jgi:PAS domain S-box-containing protein
VAVRKMGMETDFSHVVDALPGLIWTARPDGRVDYLNQRWLEYTGLTLSEACDDGWQAAIHPEDRPVLIASWRSIIASEVSGEASARMQRFDGVYRRFMFRVSPILDSHGCAASWCGINTDTEDAHRDETLLAGEMQLLEMVASGRSLKNVLTALCEVVENTVDGCRCLVLLVDTKGLFQPGASPSFPPIYADAVAGLPIHPDSGPCATAASLKGQLIVPNVSLETRWESQGWRAAMLGLGLHSCWSTSILSGNHEVLGTFAIFRNEIGVPAPFHQDLIPRITHIASVAIERARSEASLLRALEDAKRAEDLLAGEKALLELVALGSPLPSVLEALCRFVEAADPGALCGVLFFAPGGETWQHGAGPSLPAGYNETMHGRPAHRAAGPCGLAAALKAEVVIADITVDERWAALGWRELALSHGLQSCWSSPILAQDQTALGALAVYRNEPGEPDHAQQELIRQATHIASIAVERTRSESALKRSEAFLVEAQRLSTTGSFAWRVATGEVAWSAEAHRIYGFLDQTPVTFEMLMARVHSEDRARLRNAFDEASRDGAEFEHEHRLQLPDLSVRHVHTVGHAVLDENGRLEYIGAVRDVTERQVSEAALGKVRSELAHVTRALSLGALTASIAHEVNQPLSGIITNADTCVRMLVSDPPNVAGAIVTARRTIRDGHRASEVITRLRGLFAKKAAVTEPVDLNEAVREVISLSFGDLQRNRIVLQSEFDPSEPKVMGDRVQLQQVILNLLSNGSDAMSSIDDRSRSMHVTTASERNNAVRLTVKDAGTGFEPGTEERLFEAFHTTKANGMGIGLSVSRSIIERHDGRLWATANEGPGASFSFSIPRIAVVAAPIAHQPGIEANAGQVERTI